MTNKNETVVDAQMHHPFRCLVGNMLIELVLNSSHQKVK